MSWGNGAARVGSAAQPSFLWDFAVGGAWLGGTGVAVGQRDGSVGTSSKDFRGSCDPLVVSTQHLRGSGFSSASVIFKPVAAHINPIFFMFQGKLGVPGLPGYPGRQGPKVTVGFLLTGTRWNGDITGLRELGDTWQEKQGWCLSSAVLVALHVSTSKAMGSQALCLPF